MSRVKLIFKPGDYPDPDEATRNDLMELFEHLSPGEPKSEPHAGYALLAQSPRLALGIARLGDYVVRDMPWSQRRDLRELAVQALNLHFKCDFSFHAHLTYAQVSGISLEQQAAIPYWRTSHLFDDEQRLVIEYSFAVAAGDVPEELFARVVRKYGERGTVEFTSVVAWWAFWAMILNAVRPDFSFERAQPLPKDARELTGHDKEPAKR
jgi:alkylhydroperoxidase family enzyme